MAGGGISSAVNQVTSQAISQARPFSGSPNPGYQVQPQYQPQQQVTMSRETPVQQQPAPQPQYQPPQQFGGPFGYGGGYGYQGGFPRYGGGYGPMMGGYGGGYGGGFGQQQQPSWQQSDEWKGYQSQMNDLSNQLNQSPIMQQLHQLQDKMQSYQRQHPPSRIS